MNKPTNTELLLNYPDGTLELSPEETEFILGEKQMMSTFFGIDIERLSFIELLSINTGIYLNHYRDLQINESVLIKTYIESTLAQGYKSLKHKHYARIINIGMGFLATKCYDVESLYIFENKGTRTLIIKDNFIVDPYDNLLSINESQPSASLITYLPAHVN
jgi:hypothetical protein